MEWLKGLGTGKNKNALWIALGLILGVVLIFFGSSGRGGEETGREEVTAEAVQTEEQRLEEEISALLKEIPGVGEVSVMVWLECSDEEVYASGGGSVPVKRNSARVGGIGVVCPGAGDNLTLEITRLLSALFGLGSNKIYVTG